MLLRNVESGVAGEFPDLLIGGYDAPLRVSYGIMLRDYKTFSDLYLRVVQSLLNIFRSSGCYRVGGNRRGRYPIGIQP